MIQTCLMLYLYNNIFSRNSIKAHYHLQIIRPKEKHWLDECIRLNKFITKEKAMKTFVKYVKVINVGLSYNTHPQAEEYGVINFQILNNKNPQLIKNMICKVIAEPNINNNDLGYALDYNGLGYLISQKGCEISTKEEYDAQFVVKEPELIQPSKNASIEEILKYCKKKYPIGTKIKTDLNNICIINTNITIDKFDNSVIICNDSVFIRTIRQYDNRNGWSTIYKNGKYTEIVEEVKQEPIRTVNVELGSKVYSLEEITKALTKEYDKVDVQDILTVIKTIK